jgi:hypothetical protein
MALLLGVWKLERIQYRISAMFRQRGCREYNVKPPRNVRVKKGISEQEMLNTKEEVAYRIILSCSNELYFVDLGRQT